MNKLDTVKRTSVIAALVEGNSLSSTARLTNVAPMTISKLLVDVGTACADLQDRWLRGLACKRIQVDEIWSFCRMKAKNVPLAKRDVLGYGDVWTFVAIDAETKLIPCWRVGRRDDLTTDEFMFDLAERLAGRVQLTSDGLGTYPAAVQGAFDRGAGVDYGVLVKHYSEAPKEERRRYSPSKFVSAELKAVFGEPDPEHISTSYIERENGNIRMFNRRMTRLTNAFSRKLENHIHQLAINFAHHNFCRIPRTTRATPAMLAGIVSSPWNVADLVKITDEYDVTSTWELARAS